MKLTRKNPADENNQQPINPCIHGDLDTVCRRAKPNARTGACVGEPLPYYPPLRLSTN